MSPISSQTGTQPSTPLVDRLVDDMLLQSSGVTERLGDLGHIDTRGPFTMSPVTLMSV